MLLRVSPPAGFPSLGFPRPLACAPPFGSSLPPLPEPKLPVTSATPGEKRGGGPAGGPGVAPLSLLPRGIVAPRVPPASSTPPLDAPWWRCGRPELLQPRAPGTALPATGRPPLRASACVCVCASVHMCAARVQHGDILRNLPPSETQARIHLQPPLPAPNANKEPGRDVKPLPPRSFPSHTPLPPNSLPPPQKAGACSLPHAACKSEQSRCPGAARAAPRQRSLAKPLENKGCCPLATSAHRERASAGEDSPLPLLSGVRPPGPGSPAACPPECSSRPGASHRRLGEAQQSRAPTRENSEEGIGGFLLTSASTSLRLAKDPA